MKILLERAFMDPRRALGSAFNLLGWYAPSQSLADCWAMRRDEKLEPSGASGSSDRELAGEVKAGGTLRFPGRSRYL